MKDTALHPQTYVLGPSGLVRAYVVAVGAGLLLEGGGLLLVNLLALPVGVGVNDTRHNLLHVMWGVGLLLVGALPHERGSTRIAWAAVVFGFFYLSLAVLGVLVQNPFGLLLGPGENGFHFIVGPVGLVLGARALRSKLPI
jgi:hypothetical protein